MREYKKPEITVFRFLSREDISADSLENWLASQPDFSDAGILSYEVSSVVNE